MNHDGGASVAKRLNPEKYGDILKFGRITIGDNCFIGTGSIIVPGVTIGSNTFIGAGSVVTKDIPANSVAAGVPARVVKGIVEYAQKRLIITPQYDKAAYKKDKKKTVIEMLK